MANTSSATPKRSPSSPGSPSTALVCCAPLSSSLMQDGEAEDLALLFKALADPVRVKLLNLIATAGEACACDFPAAVGKSQPTTSHHLSLLVKAGLLHREQRGKWAWFWVDQDRLGALRAALD